MSPQRIAQLRESGEIIACGAFGYRAIRQKGNEFDDVAILQFKRQKAKPAVEAIAEGPQGRIVVQIEPPVEAACIDEDGTEWGEFEPDRAFGFPRAVATEIIARIEEVMK